MRIKTLGLILDEYVEHCDNTEVCKECMYRGVIHSEYGMGVRRCLGEYLLYQDVPKDVVDTVVRVSQGYISRFCGTDCGMGHKWEQCMICYIKQHVDWNIPIQVKEYVLVSDLEELLQNSIEYDDMCRKAVINLLDKVDKKTRKDLV